jgi:hypothetical protein
MIKKIRHSTKIVIMTLLVEGMVLISGKELFGQQDEDTSPPASLSTDQTS